MSVDPNRGHSSLEHISSDDHGGYIVFTIYASFFVAFGFWAARMAIRYRMLGLRLDDTFLIGAMTLSLVQGVCLNLAVNAGLGRQTINEQQTIRFEKLYYAAMLLNIASQTCSKLSINILFRRIQPLHEFWLANFIALGVSLCWGIAAFLTLAFQCDVPSPWILSKGRCLDFDAMYLGVDISNILTEAVLIAIPVVFMPTVQTTWSVRLLVIGCFASRVGVIGPLIGHAAYSDWLSDYANASWAYTIPTIWIQVAMNASILTACVPGMQHILADLRAGMLITTISPHQTENGRTGSLFTINSRNHSNDRWHNNSKTWELSRVEGVQKSKHEGENVETESARRLTVASRVGQAR